MSERVIEVASLLKELGLPEAGPQTDPEVFFLSRLDEGMSLLGEEFASRDIAALRIVAPPEVNTEDYSVAGMRKFNDWLSVACAQAGVPGVGEDTQLHLRFAGALKASFDAAMAPEGSSRLPASLQKQQHTTEWVLRANALGLVGRRPILASSVHAWVQNFGIPSVEALVKDARKDLRRR